MVGIHSRADVLKYAVFGVLALMAGPSWGDGYWEFGSWRVVVADVDTGDEICRTCSAMTGGDSDPTLMVTITDGDAGPPDGFPSTIVTERAPRGFETVLQDAQEVEVMFDSNDAVSGSAYAFTDPEGFAVAEAFFDQPSAQAVLRGMRANAHFEIKAAGRLFMAGGLDGFSASYLKVVDECGFTGAGVLD